MTASFLATRTPTSSTPSQTASGVGVDVANDRFGSVRPREPGEIRSPSRNDALPSCTILHKIQDRRSKVIDVSRGNQDGTASRYFRNTSYVSCNYSDSTQLSLQNRKPKALLN